MHVNLDDSTQSKIEDCFSQIFDFIHSAIVPTDSPDRIGEGSDSEFSKEEESDE